MADEARCPACGHGTVTAGVCARCGYAQGKGNECPHCGAIARAEPTMKGATLMGWRCAVCGGPRIPGGFGGDAARDALREEKTKLGRVTRGKAAAFGFGTVALMSLLFMLGVSLVSAALLVKILVVAIPGLFAFLATRSYTRAKSVLSEAKEVDERAWLAAAEDLVTRSEQGLSPAELAKKLSISPEVADRLLTQLAVHERTRIDVGDDAEVRYSITPEARVRVESESSSDEPAAEPAAEIELSDAFAPKRERVR
jgi:hypothetical protein